MWDLHSPTTDRIRAPRSGSLSHRAARKVPALCFFKQKELIQRDGWMRDGRNRDAHRGRGEGDRETVV